MTDNEQFISLMKLSDFRFARWRDRRTYEWRTSVGLWTLLAAAIIYLKPTGYPALATLGILLVIGVVGHAWFWVRTNWISAEMDIKTAFYFAEHAEKLVLSDAPDPGGRLNPMKFKNQNNGWQFLSAGVCQFQVFASAFLASSLFIFIAINNLN